MHQIHGQRRDRDNRGVAVSRFVPLAMVDSLSVERPVEVAHSPLPRKDLHNRAVVVELIRVVQLLQVVESSRRPPRLLEQRVGSNGDRESQLCSF